MKKLVISSAFKFSQIFYSVFSKFSKVTLKTFSFKNLIQTILNCILYVISFSSIFFSEINKILSNIKLFLQI